MSSGEVATYSLHCIGYYGHNHYVCRLIIGGKVWKFDGMGSPLIVYEGLEPEVDLSSCNECPALMAAYAKD